MKQHAMDVPEIVMDTKSTLKMILLICALYTKFSKATVIDLCELIGKIS